MFRLGLSVYIRISYTIIVAGLPSNLCHIVFLLSGDHALCGSCRKCTVCIKVCIYFTLHHVISLPDV